VVCANINCVTFRDEAPSAIRTPISLVRCSTRYDNTLKSPRHGQQQREPAENHRHPEGHRQQEGLEPRHRPQGDDLAHVRIDPGEPLEQCLPRQVGIASNASHQEGLWRIDGGRQEYAGFFHIGDTKTGDVFRDADHRDRARRQRRVRRRLPWD
jgi:hypothetical protein